MGYVRADGYAGETPTFLLSGDRRVSPRMRVMTENYFIPGAGGMVTVGLRFQGRSGSLDLGLAAPFASGGLLAVGPIINWGYRF